ncbi:MAG: hypothetical protein WCC48_00685 [Anaeromyxobacteraceae bacterium]
MSLPGRRGAASAVVAVVWLIPGLAGALEPRFDHRDQRGPTVEALAVRDVIWTGHSSMSADRGAVRVAWGFDPSGDGDEVFFGTTLSVLQGTGTGADRVKLTLDTRYRACVGTEEFKTLFDVGIWGSVADRVAVGPLVGLGFIYDFNRNFGVLTSGFLSAGIGESRIVSFGGGVGLQFRYE